MKISVLAVGKVREKYISGGIEEFLKRLRPYTILEIIELPDERAPENLSLKEEEQVKEREGDRILKAIKRDQYVVVLDSGGRMMASEELAGLLAQLALEGKSDMAFIIGGSLGLSPSVRERADVVLSFGKMTFPHQLMRLMLLEQVYRVFKINQGEPYHK